MERNLRKIPLDMSEQGRFRRERFPGRKFSRLNNYPMDNSDEDNYGKHPPHLKGKEIGLFYAMRNKNRQKSKNRHPQGTIGNRRPVSSKLQAFTVKIIILFVKYIKAYYFKTL